MNEPSSYDRRFFTAENQLTRIGSGSIGGKAQGLVSIAETIESRFGRDQGRLITVGIPKTTVIATDFFGEFLDQNDLLDTACSGISDDRIAAAFQRANLPPRLVGDLRALTDEVHTPLAVRSSSLLEDALFEPFAGVYATKMIPNNQPSADDRFRTLVEAVKLVWASTFFDGAQRYIRAVDRPVTAERMAVIIQEVVGRQYGDRFYPNLSAVARSYNFYPSGSVAPGDGVVALALGMGKTIVDGDRVWNYSPALPKAPPPFNDIGDLLKNTQSAFWAVNMGRAPEYDPTRETEHLVQAGIREAEYDDTLRFVASTYSSASDRIVLGTGADGPRVLNFAPLLELNDLPFNDLVKELLEVCEETLQAKLEIELALVIDQQDGPSARLGFLQVRPMVVSTAIVELAREQLVQPNVLVASEDALGNGRREDLEDVVYLLPDAFDPGFSALIADELAQINAALAAAGRHCVLIGFGRFGTSDPWRGIPVDWSQISEARAIVEATIPGMETELSQGSHFFHNVTSFQVMCFSVRHNSEYAIDWEWLGHQYEVSRTKFVRHVRAAVPLSIEVDGRTNRGVIVHRESE